jgi:hypothetical protein
VRELEFLPAWYPVMRRRRKLATMQAWATAGIFGALAIWGVAGHHEVMARTWQADAVAEELRAVRGDLKMLDEQLRLKQQLEQQEAILRKLGLQVDATRLLGELSVIMGEQLFLLELAADTEETIRAVGASEDPNAPVAEHTDRKLKIKLVGIAPSDVEVANFLAGLTAKPYFDQVAMTYARDRISDARIMREFEVTFVINLSGSKAE